MEMGKQKSAANGRREKEKWKRHNKTNISVKEAAKNRDRLGYLSTSDRLCPHEVSPRKQEIPAVA